jgi:hypothetical protein
LEEDWVQWGPVQKVKEVIILRAYILKKIGLNFCTLVALSAPLLALGANKEVQVIAGSGTATATSPMALLGDWKIPKILSLVGLGEL